MLLFHTHKDCCVLLTRVFERVFGVLWVRVLLDGVGDVGVMHVLECIIIAGYGVLYVDVDLSLSYLF